MKGGSKVGGDHDLDQHIREILNAPCAEAYYRERMAVPTTDSGEPKKGSKAEAEAQMKTLQKRLKKNGKGERENNLLEILSACRAGNRCARPICPTCSYGAQNVMTKLHIGLRELGLRFDACVTIIPPYLFEPSKTPDRSVDAAVEKIGKVRRRLDKAFDTSGITIVMGAIDFAYHEFPTERIRDHCRPHFHGLAFRNQLDAGEKLLRNSFSTTRSINRPVQVEPFDGGDGWLRYALKTPSSRTIRKRDAAGLWMPSIYKPLTVDQHLQQAQVLHEIGWVGKIYMRGVGLHKNEHGWGLKLTNFQPAVRGKKLVR